MAAILQTSVLAPHFPPRMTSGERYCLVWMSFVKWCDTQQALPKSAILTLMIGPLRFLFFFSLDEFDPPDDLSSEMPDTSLVRMSLNTLVLASGVGDYPNSRRLLSLFFARTLCTWSSYSVVSGLDENVRGSTIDETFTRFGGQSDVNGGAR